MVNTQIFVKKVIAVILVLFFMNSIFLVFAPEVFTDIVTLVPIVFLSIVVCFDVAIRSISAQRDRYNRIIISLAFLFFPFMVAMPYYEGLYLASIYPPVLLYYTFPIGVTILLVGSFILTASRIQIGHYGGAKIAIEDEHRLITDGMYKHIRNPQYLGFILLFAGYSLSYGSLIVMSATLVGLFVIFRSRLLLEEQLLLGTFGEEYAEYMKRTRRLLPKVY